MTNNNPDAGIPAHFSGIVRLFPLPNLVVFPGIVQALHIFEPRYRKMVEDAMASDQLITMALYQGEKSTDFVDPTKHPQIHDTVCVCKVIANHELEDGRHNLMVVGVHRAKIVREMPTEQPYRMAEVQLIDEELSITFGEIKAIREELLDTCRAVNLLDKLTENKEINKIISNDLALGLLSDFIAFVGELSTDQRQKILETPDVESRCRMLIEFMQIQNSDFVEPAGFPPKFSDN